jgi:hypothetical protein
MYQDTPDTPHQAWMPLPHYVVPVSSQGTAHKRTGKTPCLKKSSPQVQCEGLVGRIGVMRVYLGMGEQVEMLTNR